MKLRIGARNFNVCLADEQENEIFSEEPTANGYIDYYKSDIFLKKQNSDDFIKETLIHEILHALLDNSGVEELNLDKTINVLTPRIHSFLLDNENFQKFILSNEKLVK